MKQGFAVLLTATLAGSLTPFPWRHSCFHRMMTRPIPATGRWSCDCGPAISATHGFAEEIPFPETAAGDDDEVQRVLSHARRVAEAAARAAGSLILAGMGASVESEKRNFKDIVTAVDMEAQAVIHDLVRSAFPAHGVLGEEDVPAGAPSAEAALAAMLGEHEWVWIVDPVDGTANLAAGIPLVTCSIALVHRGHVVVGVVFDPARDELFSAVRGRGAELNGSPLAPLGTVFALRDAIICIGCPPDPQAFRRSLATFAALGPRVRGMRMLSSAALIFAWVAAGRVGGYVAFDINAWDFAAGKLLVDEVGGIACDFVGAPLKVTDRDTVCCSPGLRSELLSVLDCGRIDLGSSGDAE